MKRKKHGISSKWLIILLLLVIGSSIALAMNAYLRHSYLIGKQAAHNVSNAVNGSTPGTNSTNKTQLSDGYSLAVEAHHIPGTAATTPGASQNKNGTGTSTSPVIHNGATLPPGSSLSGDSA